MVDAGKTATSNTSAVSTAKTTRLTPADLTLNTQIVEGCLERGIYIYNRAAGKRNLRARAISSRTLRETRNWMPRETGFSKNSRRPNC